MAISSKSVSAFDFDSDPDFDFDFDYSSVKAHSQEGRERGPANTNK